MIEGWSPTALLVHAAALTYVIGFLIRDQLKLRLLLQIGSLFYIAYYFFEPATPLWDAIAWTTVMFLANGWTIWRLMTDQREDTFDEEDLVLFRAIPNISPGDFRRLLSKAQKDSAFVNIALTHQGKTPRNLWFLISGSATVEKDGAQRQMSAPAFVGEVAYLLERPASATVTLAAGGVYVRWPVDELRAYLETQDALKMSLEGAFNRDLALKLAAS